MDWKLEGSAQKTESRVLREHEITLDFPGCSDGKESAYNAGDPGSIPGSRRSPGEGNRNTLQCS